MREMFKWLVGRKKRIDASGGNTATAPAPFITPSPTAVVNTPKIRTVPVIGGFIPLKQYPSTQIQAQWLAVRGKVNGTLIIFADIEKHSELREATKQDPIVDPVGERDFTAILENHKSQPVHDKLQQLRPDATHLIATDPATNFYSLRSQKDSVHLGVLPCKEPWKAPAYFNFGNWKSVPADHEFLAYYKSWFDRFGAVPAFVGADFIEFWLDKPVTDPEIAADLAVEMYSLCPDIVAEGLDSLEALANSLLNANVWYFWWD